MGLALATVALAVLASSAQVPEAPESTLQRDIAREEARKHYRAGERLLTREAFERAVQEFRSATELYPDYTLAHYSMGQALMELGRYPEALAAYLDARDTIVRLSHTDQKGRARAEQDRRKETNDLEHLLQRVQSGKIKVVGESTLRHEVAIENRLRLLREAELKTGDEPRIPAELSLALGSAYYRQGRFDDAEREFRSATQRKSDLGAAHNNLAVVHMLAGRFDEARLEIRAAEEAGFRVSPLFKTDLDEKERAVREKAAH